MEKISFSQHNFELGIQLESAFLNFIEYLNFLKFFNRISKLKKK